MRATAEIDRVMFPLRITRQRSRLLPPATRLDNIELAVTIYVAHAEPVLEAAPVTLWRDGMKRPRLCRVAPVGFGIAEVAAAVAKAAMETGVARIKVKPEAVAENTRRLAIIE